MPYTGAYTSSAPARPRPESLEVVLRWKSAPSSSVCSTSPVLKCASAWLSSSSILPPLMSLLRSRSMVRWSALNTGRAGRPVRRLAVKLVYEVLYQTLLSVERRFWRTVQVSLRRWLNR
ncbi:hypothetical protein D3C72_1443890 [compost metagenome]